MLKPFQRRQRVIIHTVDRDVTLGQKERVVDFGDLENEPAIGHELLTKDDIKDVRGDDPVLSDVGLGI